MSFWDEIFPKKSKSHQFIKEYWLEIVLSLMIGGSLISKTSDILGDYMLSGWDMPAHFYLASNMVENLLSFKINSFNPNWFAGYPEFVFYGPLFYVVTALIHIFSAGTLPLALVFNALLFLLPFYFLWSFCFSSQTFFGRKSLPYALVLGFSFVAFGKQVGFIGLGIGGLFYSGLITGFLGLGLLMHFLGLFEKVRQKFSWRKFIWAVLLLTILFLSHTLTSIFAFCALVLQSLVRKKTALIAAKVFTVSFLLSAFWWLPFFENLWLTSGEMLDSLPESYFNYVFLNFSFQNLFFLDGLSWESFKKFPLLSLIIMSGIVLGSKQAFLKKDYFWVSLTAFGLIILPEAGKFFGLSIPLHYYRFVPHFLMGYLFLAIIGFTNLKLASGWPKNMRNFLLIGVTAFLMAPFNFNLHQDEVFYRGRNFDYSFDLSGYPGNESAMAMVDYVSSKEDLSGRIATQIGTGNDMRALGTAHLFDTFLAARGIPVVPGLLAESSFSNRFINPVMFTLIDSLVWGNRALLRNQEFMAAAKTDPGQLIRKLGLFNVEYILSSGQEIRSKLEPLTKDEKWGQLIELEKDIEVFSLFRIKEYRPFLEKINQAPFLFVDNGGMDFLSFTESWYSRDDLIDYPIIFTKKDFEEIPTIEKDQMQGLIVSHPVEELITQAQIDAWKHWEKPIVFLGTPVEEATWDSNRYFVFSPVNLNAEEFSAVFKSVAQPIKAGEPITPIRRENEFVSFTAQGGVTVNYSYFPRWKSHNPDQTIYLVTPSLMFVFSDGLTELWYD